MMARFGAVLVVLLVGLMPRLGQAGAPLQARSPVISTGQDRCYALTAVDKPNFQESGLPPSLGRLRRLFLVFWVSTPRQCAIFWVQCVEFYVRDEGRKV